MTTLRSWLQGASAQLEAITDSSTLDAQVLLAHFLRKPRSWVLAYGESELEEPCETALNQALSQLLNGTPLPYLLGHWEFFGLNFIVSPAVLIPRPETELLVETALAWLKRHPGPRLAADIGTGSGCIAISLAKHICDLSLIAVDISRPALRVAHKNVQAHQLTTRVRLVQGNLMQPLRARFDLICSNPPYIPSPKLPGLTVTRHEPRLALDGGPDGLQSITVVLEHARHHLTPGGLLLIEIESGQGQTAPHLARQFLPHAHISVLPDLGGHPRLLCVQNAG